MGGVAGQGGMPGASSTIGQFLCELAALLLLLRAAQTLPFPAPILHCAGQQHQAELFGGDEDQRAGAPAGGQTGGGGGRAAKGRGVRQRRRRHARVGWVGGQQRWLLVAAGTNTQESRQCTPIQRWRRVGACSPPTADSAAPPPALALVPPAEDEDEDEAENATLHIRKVAHTGGINRVRAMPQQPAVVASWADTAQVQVWDLAEQVGELREEEGAPAPGSSGKVHRVAARQVHTHSSGARGARTLLWWERGLSRWRGGGG